MFNPYFFPLKYDTKNSKKLRNYIELEPTWFHSFEFQDGLTTPGRDPSAKKLHHLCLPRDLSGLSVIDIGAYDGYFSFHAEQRGAKRVVSSDSFVWENNYVGVRNFRAIKELIGSRVEEVLIPVERLSTLKESFDVSMFLGVLYHAPNLVEYLENVAAVTKTVCVVETLVDCLDQDRAMAASYADGSINGDTTNHWGPNVKALTDLILRVGFKRIEFCNLWDMNTIDAIQGRSTLGALKSGRLVLHAFK